jgi:D-glycero-alpha-D-manno-heptose-7-phosphate kinase
LYSLKNLEIEGPALANQAITFEQNDLKEIVGSQDQIACAMGGINFIEFTGDNFWVAKKIELSKEYLTDLESRMVLVYSGIGRISSNISKTLLENLDLKSNLMHRTRKLAIEFNDLLVNKENLDSVAELLKESWSLKKELNTNSIPIELENIYQFALSKGAQAGKILGAGGGGFFLFWLKPGSKEKFIKDMTPLVTVPFSITNQGCSRIS